MDAGTGTLRKGMGSTSQNTSQGTQQAELPAMGTRCLLTGAVSSLPSHYAVLTPQARRPRAWQNGQGTTAKYVFISPCLQPCREQEEQQRLQAQGTCLKPPKIAEPQVPVQAGDCCWLRPLCWKQKQKEGENLSPGLARRMHPSSVCRT